MADGGISTTPLKYKIPGFWKWYWTTRWLKRVTKTLPWIFKNDFRVIAHIIEVQTYTHSWFVNNLATKMLYIDATGCWWVRATGKKKSDIPTYTLPNGITYINALGGQSWTQSAYDPNVFICEYATTSETESRVGHWGPSILLSN